MMKKIIKKVWSWSYSAYSCYHTCPQQYYFKYIAKIKEPPSPALLNGIHVHQLGEDYLKDKLKKVPEEYNLFHGDMEYVKSKGAVPEEQFTFTKNWKSSVGWWDKTAWLRLKIDQCLDLNKSGSRVKITDYKTGRVRKGTYSTQTDLYAVAKFQTNPKIKEIIPDFWFLDHGIILDNENDKTIKEVYLAKELPSMKKKWLERIKPMQNDKVFAPKRNYLCNGWCSYCKAKGGQCQY